MFVSHGAYPQITLPTRFSKNKATLIDQIFCRYSKNMSQSQSGLIMTKISDHLPCFFTLNLPTKCIQRSKYVKIRRTGPDAMEDFRTEIEREVLNSSFENDLLADPNVNYATLENIIKIAREKCFPIKEAKFNKYKHKISPWITMGILNSIKYRDRLYVNWKKCRPHSPKYHLLETSFKSFCGILQKSIRLAKTQYYYQQFQNYKADIKKTWNKINEIIRKNKKCHDLPKYFLHNEQILTDDTDIAICFNNFFSQIGPTLANSIETPVNKSHKDYLKTNIASSFSFSSVSENDILKIISKLKSKSSCGHDGLSTILLKYIAKEIVCVLTRIINQSLCTGIFPNSLKIAKIMPVFKKDDPHIADNYRPISLLPSISKVFEKVAYIQVYDYFMEKKLLYNSQYGFRKMHSTELAALEITDKIILHLDQGKLPLAIYLDLSKAFDTIDHSILLYKLQYYGIHGNAIEWFKSYLSNRKQYVEINGKTSPYANITTGVPQGSILGPLLFIIYMNDIASVTDHFHSVLYADDTSLLEPLCTFTADIN